MLQLYSIASLLAALLSLPFAPLILAKKKYRRRLLQRLGFGLAAQLSQLPRPSSSLPTIWLHALSVGEITSALPLVRGLRESLPHMRLIVSATSQSGQEVAHRLLSPYADALIAGPIDIGPVIPFFIQTIKPDLFILVETDFWPHWLHCLARRRIPLLLVNGRISHHSFSRYKRFAFLCRPMFRSFTFLSMQTADDAQKMRSLGIDAEKIVALGNLKFDSRCASGQTPQASVRTPGKQEYGFSAAAPLWICGSTHRGEEETILHIFLRLRETVPELQLMIAPRNIERADEILSLAAQSHLSSSKWSEKTAARGPILLLDTIGELAACYQMADIVFVGGSLVAEGGHNPIEPAIAGAPVLFGPHMEDFSEIAQELVQDGGALQIDSGEALFQALQTLLADPTMRCSMTEAAQKCILAHQGVIQRHIHIIARLLARSGTDE